jgi:hypothetical protein
MFVDYWCPRCGEKIASNRYKISERRWANDRWKAHFGEIVKANQARHDATTDCGKERAVLGEAQANAEEGL